MAEPKPTRLCEHCGVSFTPKDYGKRAQARRFCSNLCSNLAEPRRKPITPLADRLWAKVDKNGPIPTYRPDLGRCWIWLGAAGAQGHGRLTRGPRGTGWIQAHRCAYELLVGPIPPGLELDHLCRVPQCVNPQHLEPVTHKENDLRGASVFAANAKKTHCKYGHEFTPENTQLVARGRQCRTCQREWARQH